MFVGSPWLLRLVVSKVSTHRREGREAEGGRADGRHPVDGNERLVLEEERAALQSQKYKVPGVAAEDGLAFERRRRAGGRRFAVRVLARDDAPEANLHAEVAEEARGRHLTSRLGEQELGAQHPGANALQLELEPAAVCVEEREQRRQARRRVELHPEGRRERAARGQLDQPVGGQVEARHAEHTSAHLPEGGRRLRARRRSDHVTQQLEKLQVERGGRERGGRTAAPGRRSKLVALQLRERGPAVVHREALAAGEEEQPQQVRPQSIREAREVQQQRVDEPGSSREGVLVVRRCAHDLRQVREHRHRLGFGYAVKAEHQPQDALGLRNAAVAQALGQLGDWVRRRSLARRHGVRRTVQPKGRRRRPRLIGRVI